MLNCPESSILPYVVWPELMVSQGTQPYRLTHRRPPLQDRLSTYRSYCQYMAMEKNRWSSDCIGREGTGRFLRCSPSTHTIARRDGKLDQIGPGILRLCC